MQKSLLRKLSFGVGITLLALPLINVQAASIAADAAMQQDFAALELAVKQERVNQPQADGSTALHWAIHWNNADAVDLLLAAGADPDLATRLGATPLYLAALDGNAALVAKLLTAGADANQRILSNQETALMFAARSGNVESVRLLLDAGAEINAKESYKETTALMWAAEQDHAGVAALMTERGADTTATSKLTVIERRASGIDVANGADPEPQQFYLGAVTAINFAARENGIETVKALLDAGIPIDQQTGDGSSPLLIALQNAHLDLARLLIDRGADVNLANRKGWNPLYMAVKVRNQEIGTMPNPDANGMYELIQTLIDKGADVNARITGKTEVHDAIASTWLKEPGATPFLRAAWCGDLEVMKLLMAHGADPFLTTDDGTTALMAVAGVGYAQGFIKDFSGREQSAAAMRLLIDTGLDVNAMNTDSVMALHGAAHKNFVEGIQLLVDNGADLGAQSLWRKIPATPLDWAIGVRIGGSSTIYQAEAVELLEKLVVEHNITVKTVYPNNNRGG